MSTAKDFPFDTVTQEAFKIVQLGGEVHQKFTCAGCGARLTMDEPNHFFELGTCDRCDAVTNIKAQGCNYMVLMNATTAAAARR